LRIKNNGYIYVIHYLSHKGRTRIIRKFENEVGGGSEVKKSRRREGKRRREIENRRNEVKGAK